MRSPTPRELAKVELRRTINPETRLNTTAAAKAGRISDT
jgi:hypothetical protein